jgi:DNA-binding IclR family transcriptional regulator
MNSEALVKETGKLPIARTRADGGEESQGSEPLRRAAMILDAVAAARDGTTIQQISHNVGLPASTTYRLAQSLLAINYLNFDAKPKTYRIGPRLVRLVHMSLDTATIQQMADPLLQQLAHDFRQTAFLTQLAGDEVQLVSCALPTEPLGSIIYPGGRLPFHASATGKATLAFQPETVVERCLQQPLRKLQPATIVDPRKIRRELAKIRSLGYAVIDSEFDPGTLAVACPVLTDHENVIFAVGIVGLKVRMLECGSVENFGAALKSAAHSLAALLKRG